MSQVPTISVLMPVYNAEKYLAAAVESVLKQTFADFEFLIIDDGSSDRSLQILQSYAAKETRIRLTSRPNTGYVVALNEMLAKARGEFVARMDADDIALPERFARQVAFLRQHSDVLCVGTAQEWIDEDGDVLTHWQPTANSAELQQLMLSGQNHLCHPSAMMRREAAIAVGGYDESLIPSEDLDLWLKLGEIGQLSNLPETLLKYRIHTSSVSETRVKQQTQSAQEACRRAWQRRGIQGRYEVTESWRHGFLLRCGWQMFSNGLRQKAIAYGIRAVKAIPFNLESWRLLTCALIKPLPEGQAR
jgi:cellulose synthase/poly-beta-1,6-N-acetylglucosamine synthase-like glycosyltransferase